MTGKTKKKLKSAEQLIVHMKSKGIKFNIVSEKEAINYLENNNNYFKLAAFRKNYPKHPAGEFEGQYIDLEFAYLKDLAIIDMTLRYTVVHLALDIEHHAKLQLMREAEAHNEDGYAIIKDYFESLDDDKRSRAESEIERNVNSIYCGAIIDKYKEAYPIWAFIEIVPFGQLLSFYRFCADRYKDKKMQNTWYQLMACKEIRNASAHSNCVLNDLTPNSAKYNTSNDVMKSLSAIKGISKNTRKSKMSNARIQQIVTLLYVHRNIVTSAGVLNKGKAKLKDLTDRMDKHADYYQGHDMIRSAFGFLKKIIEAWYLTEDPENNKM